MYCCVKTKKVVKKAIQVKKERDTGLKTIRVFISNASSSLVSWEDQSFQKAGRCRLSFERQLRPGQAGLICLEGEDEFGMALQLWLGDERLLIGAKHPKGAPVAAGLEFAPDPKKRSMESFYKSLSKKWMSPTSNESDTCVNGSSFSARLVNAWSGSHHSSIHVILHDRGKGATDLHCILELHESVESLVHVNFAEWCMIDNVAHLGSATFLMELAAVMSGVQHLSLHDRAFAFTLLINGFIHSGALDLSFEKIMKEIQRCCESVPPGLKGEKLPKYDSYTALKNFAECPISTATLAEYVDAASLLLKAAALQCAESLQDTVTKCKADESWGPFAAPVDLKAELDDQSTNLQKIQHSETKDDGAIRNNTSAEAEYLNMGGSAQGLRPAPQSKGKDNETDCKTTSMVRLVQECVHNSSIFAIRLSKVFNALMANLPDESAKAALRHYREWICVTRRRFASHEDANRFNESWCSDFFFRLDDGQSASPTTLTQSLGRCSRPARKLATNSKSGEFFFFSNDGRFIVKTVSDHEGKMLLKMITAYQAHMLKVPHSLIVRYAGVFRAEVSGVFRYFTVMASVLKAEHPVDELYDVKGSTFGRKKKAHEQVSKDMDWVETRRRINLPNKALQKICEAHEQDATFLMSFGVMDYSLLVGIHHLKMTSRTDRSCKKQTIANEFVTEEDIKDTGVESSESQLGMSKTHSGVFGHANDAYYIGIIDFLIFFGVKKAAENLVNTMRGHETDASCVDPWQYAARQVRFVRTTICSTCPGMAYPGTFGLLRVEIVSASNLRSGDFLASSDPYVEVTLGLQKLKTHTISHNNAPQWNFILSFAVDQAHLTQNVELSIWDHDNRAFRGEHDFLGKLSIPLKNITPGTPLVMNESLSGVKSGELNIRLKLSPVEHCHPVPESQSIEEADEFESLRRRVSISKQKRLSGSNKTVAFAVKDTE